MLVSVFCVSLLQVLSVITIGNDQDGLSLETALGLETSNFISHFTCPSFAINEVSHTAPLYLLCAC